MSDTLSAARLEPVVATDGRTEPSGADHVSRPTAPEIVVPAATPLSAPVQPTNGHGRSVGAEPLARIEDKTSRIEEKLARSEASMQRVVDRFELASARMNEVASQSELAAVRGEVAFIARRVRRSPGPMSLVVTAVATSILTAIVVLLLLRYMPGVLAR